MSNRIAVNLTLATLVSLASCFSSAESERPVMQASVAQVDAARGRVWSLTRDGVLLHDEKKPQGIAVTLPGWQWAGAPYGCLPAIALGPQGEAIVTSDIVPTLWRIDPETLAVSVHAPALQADTDKDVGFSWLAYSREHDAFLAASGMLGSFWSIDRSLTRAQKIGTPSKGGMACATN